MKWLLTSFWPELRIQVCYKMEKRESERDLLSAIAAEKWEGLRVTFRWGNDQRIHEIVSTSYGFKSARLQQSRIDWDLYCVLLYENFQRSFLLFYMHISRMKINKEIGNGRSQYCKFNNSKSVIWYVKSRLKH